MSEEYAKEYLALHKTMLKKNAELTDALQGIAQKLSA